MRGTSGRTVTLAQPRIGVIIENPRSYGSPDPVQIEVEGILDTGATLVLIPLATAQRLALTRISRCDVETPASRQRGYVYDAVVSVPLLGQVHEVQVASLTGVLPPGPDEVPLVLLGKSLLRHYHFCMLGPEGKYTLSVP
jgi:hypothetical protein